MTFDKWWEQHSYLSKDHAEVMYAEMSEFGMRVANKILQYDWPEVFPEAIIEALVREVMGK